MYIVYILHTWKRMNIRKKKRIENEKRYENIMYIAFGCRRKKLSRMKRREKCKYQGI